MVQGLCFHKLFEVLISKYLKIKTLKVMSPVFQTQQISELVARVEKVKTKETTTTTTAADNAPAILTSTPAANTTYTYELKGLKDPNAVDGTRSQYLL
jgi:hypothetical protein